MCKINGQSIFKWMFATPLAVADEVKYQKNKDNKKDIAAAKTNAAETISKNSQGDEMSATATTAQVNKQKKNQTLNSLRVPLETSNVGASVGSTATPLGLNLGG